MDSGTSGKLTRKLLHKTTRSFLSLAIVILVVSAPIFYFAAHRLYIYETDEVLIFHKEDFVRNLKKHGFAEADIPIWNHYNRNSDIIPFNGIPHDSIVTRHYIDSTSQEWEPVRVLWAPIMINGKRYTYTETSNLVVMEGMVVSVAVLFLLVIAFLMTGIIWLSKRSASKLWAPFYDTLAQMQEFELDKANRPRFTATDIAEFARLNQSLERLIEKNLAIYQQQREFVENAAHELQTPLALFQAKIDSLAQLPMNEGQSILLAALNQDVARLNRLNRNLLLLSKIDNDTYLESEPVVLNQVLEKHFAFFTEQAAAKAITVATELEPLVTVQSNAVLADVLLNNLFLNAIRHNKPHGKIQITLTHSSIEFANTSDAAPIDGEKLFNRFAKIDPSGKGNGLGLAIVKRIVELNGWKIDYRHDGLMHFFRVRF